MNSKGQVGIGILVFVLFVILCLGGSWLTMGNDFFLYKFFAPKMENVRREVYINTQSYNQGMAQDLDNYYADYQKATPDGKAAIAGAVLHEMAGYDDSRLPGYLQSWVEQLRSSR